MAILLNGTTQAVNLGLNINILRNTGACTLMAWVRPAAVQAGAVISIGIGPPPGASGLSRANLEMSAAGAFFCGFRAADAEAAAQTITVAGQYVLGQWGHFAVTCNYATGSLAGYKNGLLIGSTAVTFTQATTSDTNSKNCAIGSGDDTGAPFFAGAIEDVRVYNRLLSPDEIATIAAAFGGDGIVNGLQLRIGLDEAGENTAVASCPSITDDVRLVGTPVAAPLYTSGIIRGTRKRWEQRAAKIR